MPTTKAHKTRHHSNLRPKHRHTKKYLESYWPYIPLLLVTVLTVSLWQPWHSRFFGGQVLPYATNISPDALLQATNRERAKDGESQLHINNDLSQAAQSKANDMVSKNYWSHNTPSGEAPWVFISQSGYQYEKAGENLAYGFVSSDQVITGWMNSATHRANILDKTYQDVGFGFANSNNFTNSGPNTVVVAMYGSPLLTSTDAEQLKPTTEHAVAASYNSNDPNIQPTAQGISKMQMLTKGLLPWSKYVGAALTGAAAMYLILKHGIRLKRWIRGGERFIISHPVLDATIFVLGILGLVIIQKVGVIL